MWLTQIQLVPTCLLAGMTAGLHDKCLSAGAPFGPEYGAAKLRDSAHRRGARSWQAGSWQRQEIPRKRGKAPFLCNFLFELKRKLN